MVETNNDITRTAFDAVDNYRGDEASYHAAEKALTTLENAIKVECGIASGLPTKEQERAFNIRHGGESMSISEMLLHAEEVRTNFIHDLLSGDSGARSSAERADILTLDQDRVFLPSEPTGHTIVSGGVTQWEDPKLRNRTEQVILWLTDGERRFNGHQIFMDQLVIHHGRTDPDTMRKAAPYSVIDVVPLGIQIAVCDQMNEAMFVLPKSSNKFSVIDWANTSKADLVEHHGAARIMMGKNWGVRLSNAMENSLAQDSAIASRDEINHTKAQARAGRVPVTPELLELKNRKDLGATQIMNKLMTEGQCPIGLSVPIIDKLFDTRRTSTPLAAHLDAVMKVLLAADDAPTKVNLDEEGRRDRFIDGMKQKGFGTTEIIKRLEANNQCPEGLNVSVMNNWFGRKKSNGKYGASSARQDHFDAAIGVLEAPDDDPEKSFASEVRGTQEDRGIAPDFRTRHHIPHSITKATITPYSSTRIKERHDADETDGHRKTAHPPMPGDRDEHSTGKNWSVKEGSRSSRNKDKSRDDSPDKTFRS